MRSRIGSGFVGIFVFIGFAFAEKAPYSFAKEATLASSVEYYDYVIVGGGTAGCALAATLSVSAKVLLLERGALPYNNPNLTTLAGFQLSSASNSSDSPSQPFVSTDGVFNNRARVLGGGSAINAGFFTYASTKYVQQAGWDPQLVKESYEWARRKVSFRPQLKTWQAAVRDGLLEAGVLPYRGFTYEHLYGTKIGGSIFDENGNRHSAADLLEYANHAKITVYLHATVHKIVIEQSLGRKKAHGVVFKDSKGTTHSAYLNNGLTNEIILSAGALGSPQLLLLSGIGPAHQLKAHGIDVVLDQPMVGQGMSDNPLTAVVVLSPKPLEKSLIQVVGISDTGNYIEATSGFLAQSWVPIVAQYYAKLVNQTNRSSSGPSNIQLGRIAQKVARPFSTGHLELESKDPNDNPRVTFNYLQDPRDLQKCVQGMKIIKRIVESRTISSFRFPSTTFQSLIDLMLAVPVNQRKKHPSAAYSLKQFCNDTVATIYHYHGGCQVNRVVDSNYKVIGIDALRVVDGSTFKVSPGTNPQATVMMLGRYVGQKILQERVHN